MSEGELYKKIHTIGYREYGDLEISDNDLKRILDEAKQEYHYGAPIIFLDPKNLTPEKVQQVFDLLSKVIKEKDDWFKKYFGDGE